MGTGNTVCFWPGVRWGAGVVLHFDTCTRTITSRGFYVVFGHTPDSVRNFISYLLGGRGCWNTSGILVCKSERSMIFYLFYFYYF